MGKPVFPCPHFSLPLFHSHIYFFFLPAGFLQAFNQGQYVPTQHFSFFMQHCPLKLFAAGWWLNCCQYPLRAPPRRAHIGHLPKALQVPRRQLGLECISGSAYQAVEALRGSSFQEPGSSWVARRSTRGAVVNWGVFHTEKRNLVFNLKWVCHYSDRRACWWQKELGGDPGDLCVLVTAYMLSQFLHSQWTYWASPQKGKILDWFSPIALPTLISQSFFLLPKTYGNSLRSPWKGYSPRWTDLWVRSFLTCAPGKCFFGYSTFEALLQSSFSMHISSKTSSGKSAWMRANPSAPVYFICEMITLQESHGSSNYVLCEWLILCPAITLDCNTSYCVTVGECLHQCLDVLGGGQVIHHHERLTVLRSPQIRLDLPLHIYPFCDLVKFYAPSKSH